MILQPRLLILALFVCWMTASTSFGSLHTYTTIPRLILKNLAGKHFKIKPGESRGGGKVLTVSICGPRSALRSPALRPHRPRLAHPSHLSCGLNFLVELPSRASSLTKCGVALRRSVIHSVLLGQILISSVITLIPISPWSMFLGIKSPLLVCCWTTLKTGLGIDQMIGRYDP